MRCFSLVRMQGKVTSTLTHFSLESSLYSRMRIFSAMMHAQYDG